MKSVSALSSIASYKTVARSGGQQAPPAPEVKVATEVASLSLETRLDLSQKSQAAPPPPPPDPRKSKAKEARKPDTPGSVATTDFTGRSCTGSLHGPLLMEDPHSPGFVFDNPRDFEDLQSAGKLLSRLDPEILLGASSEKSLAELSLGESKFSYFGIKDGQGLLMQHRQHETAEVSQVQLPGGQVAQISRELDRLCIYLPAVSLEEMAQWGGRLLAEA
jgi:hypothetical protein